jgi:hypothetical protein
MKKIFVLIAAVVFVAKAVPGTHFLMEIDGVLYRSDSINNFKIWRVVECNGETRSPLAFRKFIEYDGKHCKMTELDSVATPSIVSRTVTVPNSVELICDKCFCDCCGIFNVAFEDGSRLKRIGNRAFDSAGLHQICIPRGTEYMGNECFYGCRNLRAVTFEPGSKLDMIRCAAFASSGIRAIRIPAAVAEIGSECFLSCSYLRDVAFDPFSKVEKIQSGAFSATNITRMYVPSSVEALDDECFLNCNALDVLIFESISRLRRIDNVSSENKHVLITKLEKDIPRCRCIEIRRPELLRVDMIPFVSSNADTCVWFIGDRKKKITVNNVVYRLNDGTTAMAMRKEIWKPRVTVFRKFIESEGRKYLLSSTGFFSKTADFTECTTVSVPNSVEWIYSKCFGGCRSLREVLFEADSKLRQIGAEAFAGTSVAWMRIPRSVRYLGEGCFDGCSNLLGVVFESDSRLRLIRECAFQNAYTLRAIHIPRNTGMIYRNCFFGCVGLSGVTFESGSRLVSIGNRAFCRNWNLKSMSIPDGVEYIGEQCFLNCTGLEDVRIGIRTKLMQVGCTRSQDKNLLLRILKRDLPRWQVFEVLRLFDEQGKELPLDTLLPI